MGRILTLSLDEFDIGDADVIFEEADDRERNVVKNFTHSLFYHMNS